MQIYNNMNNVTKKENEKLQILQTYRTGRYRPIKCINVYIYTYQRLPELYTNTIHINAGAFERVRYELSMRI